MQTLPELRDVATDQQTQRHDAAAQDQPRHRLALRHPAAADRRHALRRVRPAPGRAVFHPAQQLPRGPGDPAGAAGQPRHARQDLRQVADHRRRGAAVDLRQHGPACRSGRCRSATRASSRRSPSASTSPRAWRWARRPTRSRRRWPNSARPPRSIRASRAPRRRSSIRSAPCRYLILAALVVVYIILGILYESYIHPLTILSTLPSAGVGALLILMAVRLRLQPDRADRHHPADRHRQEERHHDGRLRASPPSATSTCRRSNRSARPRCCASARS